MESSVDQIAAQPKKATDATALGVPDAVSVLDLRAVFLTLHVAAGVLGLLLGASVLRPPLALQTRLWRRRAYLASLVALLVFLVATVATDWSRLDTTQRIIFVGLIGLALVIAARGVLAFRIMLRRPRSWEATYMEHIYFTYLSLWEGFFIVGLIDLGAAPLVVAAVGVGLVIVGANRFGRYKAQILASRAELGRQSAA